MSTHTHYFCPQCEGHGEYNPSMFPFSEPDCWQHCMRCDGSGVIDGDDLELHENACPYTPSTRTHYSRPIRDILESLAYDRSKARHLHYVSMDWLRRYGAHSRAGLAQADMLARATMCANAAERAVSEWRKAS